MKKIKKILVIKLSCILLFLNNISCYGQNAKNITFKYEGGCETHIVNRSYLTDSTFIDSSTIAYFKDKKYFVIDTFKILTNEWFYLSNNKWVLYFSKEKFDKREKIFWCDTIYKSIPYPPFVTVIPLRIESVKGKNIYVYKIEEQNDVLSTNVEYYFDFEFGVIKIIDTGLGKGCQERVVKR